MSDERDPAEKAIDHLTESRDVLGNVASALRTENANLRIETKRLRAILKSVSIAMSGSPENGADAIRKERFRQIMEEGWDADHDDTANDDEQLARAAACYAMPDSNRGRLNYIGGFLSAFWPWDCTSWRPNPEKRKRELEKSGALAAAEWDRLDRLEKAGGAS